MTQPCFFCILLIEAGVKVHPDFRKRERRPHLISLEDCQHISIESVGRGVCVCMYRPLQKMQSAIPSEGSKNSQSPANQVGSNESHLSPGGILLKWQG